MKITRYGGHDGMGYPFKKADGPFVFFSDHQAALTAAEATIAGLREELSQHANWTANKDALHIELDAAGAPPCKGEPCRISVRVRWLMAQLTARREQCWRLEALYRAEREKHRPPHFSSVPHDHPQQPTYSYDAETASAITQAKGE